MPYLEVSAESNRRKTHQSSTYKREEKRGIDFAVGLSQNPLVVGVYNQEHRDYSSAVQDIRHAETDDVKVHGVSPQSLALCYSQNSE